MDGLNKLESNGWIRNTSTPKTVLPSGSWDCHFHVYGAGALSEKRTYDPPDASYDDMRRMHRVLGIDRGVIVQPTIYGTDHTALIDALRQGRGSYVGIAVIDENVTDAELQALSDAGVCGARFNFLAALGIDWPEPIFTRLVDRIAELGWITQIHGSAAELSERAAMFCREKTPVIIDHMAHIDMSEEWKSDPSYRAICDLLSRENFWMKLSNGDRMTRSVVPYDDTAELAQSFIRIAPGRCIWATDWPHILYKGEVPNDGDLVDACARYCDCHCDRGNDETLKRVMADNPNALFGPFLRDPLFS